MLIKGGYLLEVEVFGYNNPTGRCQDCLRPAGKNERSCCDSPNHTICSGDQRCDSYFVYCSRPLNSYSEEASCHFGERVISTVNVDDGPVNFSQSTVLGLENPLQLQGPSQVYEVDNFSC